MLKQFITSAETYRNSTRPAIYDSLRQTLQFYGLDSIANIFYNGENEISKLVGSNIDDKPRTDIYTDGIFRNKIFIVPEVEAHGFNSGYGSSRRALVEMPVWSNDKLNMRLIPVFEGRKVNVEVVAHFNSRQGAQNFVNKINYAQSNQVVDFNFSANVHFVVNVGILDLFSNIHGLLRKNDLTTPELGEWFAASAKSPFTKISNAIGENSSIAVPMQLNNIGIQFNEPKIQLARKASLTGSYEVVLSYYFYYQEFIGWDLEYPLNVYQDEIDPEFIPRTQPKFREELGFHTGVELAQGRILDQSSRKFQNPYYLKLPDHDPWAWQAPEFTAPIVQARLTVEDEEEQILCNLFEIPDFTWNDNVKKYILRRGNKVFFQHESPFLIEVYSGELRIHPKQLRIDEDGNIHMKRRPTMWNTHRLIVGLDIGIRSYTDDFWDDLISHPDDWGILPPIFPWWPWEDKPAEEWIKNKCQLINGIDLGYGKCTFDWCRYMMYLGLIAYNEEDYGLRYEFGR